MSQSLRQSELFAGGDWLVLYRAFTEVNLNAFDFDSIRAAMTTYIRQNYPEDFNDWIESSEFVAILDLLAYLGQSLAFRMDINARENFMDVARRRESILRLARFLSYSPKRNYPARGLVKLTEVKTSNDVYDSSGRNLNNKAIRWDDANNPDWFEQWVLVLNDTLVSTNPFGTPLKTEGVDNITTQLYRLENVSLNAGNYPFTAYVNGQNLNFDIVNPDFNQKVGFFEQTPNPKSKFHLIYRSDGNGNSSSATGFFMYFKQGSLQYSDFILNEPQENRSISIAINNINETDVWVQTVNDSGASVAGGQWTRVGGVPTDNASKLVLTTDNITYNSVNPDIQNIFQVVTQENDQIALRFGDGRFGKIPTGNLRAWYRTSANQNLSVRPDNMQDIKISVPYTASSNVTHRLTVGFSLKETVDNAVMAESNADVKRRAALVSKTQGRMVSGEDYNSLPVSTNLAIKIKAINRVYSGQSRFIDLNDPTGTYQDTNVYGDDGCLYLQENNSYQEIPLASNPTNQDILTNYLLPLIGGTEIRDFLIDEWRKGTAESSRYAFSYPTPSMYWQPTTGSLDVGKFQTSGGVAKKLGLNAASNTTERYMTTESQVKFNTAGWVTLTRVLNMGDGNTDVRLSQEVEDNDYLLKVLPAYAGTLPVDTQSQVVTYLASRRTFGMGYNFEDQSWYFIEPTNLNGQGAYDIDTQATALDSSWLVKCEYSPLNWRITARGLQYVFESKRSCKFFFVNEFKGVDPQTGKVSSDVVKILKYNNLTSDQVFSMSRPYTYSDGFMEPRRVQVRFHDSDADGQSDNPESFNDIVSSTGLVFHKRETDVNGYDVYNMVDLPTWTGTSVASAPSNIASQGANYRIPTTGPRTSGSFYQGSSMVNDDAAFTVNLGRTGLSFQWKHYAPSDHRIDPAISNIIDIFVLSRDYNDRMISWRNSGAGLDAMPVAPTERQLRLNYSELEQFKMFTDEIVWRPVKFKMLFGLNADPELRVKFKVVKTHNTTLSDGEIKSEVVAAIEKFFDVNRWDFGETFYFTDLATAIHRQLPGAIASVVPVPISESQSFGGLFEIRSQPDEIFFSTAQVSDVEIIPANTQTSLRIR